ncbi:MAG: hypothetical protein PVG33_08975 [Chloroflexota bacterium]|jgi:hypothetical protein
MTDGSQRQQETSKLKQKPPVRPEALQAADLEELRFGLEGVKSVAQPPPLTPHNVGLMQPLIGNRAIMRLLDSAIQRDDADTEEASGSEPLNSELERYLDEIGALRDRVPAVEAISATTAAGYSRREFSREIESLWRQQRVSFTEAARHIAQEDTLGRSGPRATQGPRQEAEGGYGQRWSLNLLAADFESGSDLMDIADLARARSDFQQSQLGEFDRVLPVALNPAASEMSSRIRSAVMALWDALESGQNGELVVTYVGHGNRGAIFGVDGEVLSPADLIELSQFAADLDVHILYILDTCRAGNLVSWSQGEAMERAGERIEELPADRQATAEDQLGAARVLGRSAYFIGELTVVAGDAIRDYRRQNTSDNLQSLQDALDAVEEKMAELNHYLFGDEIPENTPSNREALANSVLCARITVRTAHQGSAQSCNRAMRYIAQLLDVLNDSINGLLEGVGTE